jgi:hypothetical protein
MMAGFRVMPTKLIPLARIVVDDEAVDVRRASLTVSRDDASPAEIGLFDWEVVAHSGDKRWLVQGEYRLTLEAEDGRRFEGRANLTTTDGTTHLFRGIGNLGGFEQAELSAEESSEE